MDTVRHYSMPNGASLQAYMPNGIYPRIKFVGHMGDVLIATLGHIGDMEPKFTMEDLAKLVDDMWATRGRTPLHEQVLKLMQLEG